MVKHYSIKKYIVLCKRSADSHEYLWSLKFKRSAKADGLFIERLQPTKGFFKPKVLDYVEPKNWGRTDPCEVTIYRNGAEDWLSDYMHNFGTAEDVRTFTCPHFKEGEACTQNCRYSHQYNEYLELDTKLIPAAQKEYDAIVAERKAAWKQIFKRSR